MKKFWDIVPPSNFEEIKNNTRIKKEIIKSRKYNFNGFRLISTLVTLFFLGLGLFVTFRMSKSEVNIWPVTESLNFSSNFKVSLKTSNIDYSKNIIPGQIIEEEKIISEDFPSTGNVMNKAEGVIRLFNAYSAVSETWLKGTRFVSENGKFFKSKDIIKVPGRSIENSKIVPGFVDVPVIAAEAGEEYNIKPSSFSIYVYRGTEKYTKFYGESYDNMNGGGKLAQINQNDLDSAKNVLVEKTKKESSDSLSKNLLNDLVLINDVYNTTILESYSSKKLNDTSEKFSFTVRGKSRAIVFKADDAKKIIEDFASSQIPEDKSVYDQSIDVVYKMKNIDWDNGEMVVNFDVSFKSYPSINLAFLRGELGGKSSTETKFLLENQPEITKVEISFWPFWVKNIPTEESRVIINYPIID